jgi:hypothetical protein
MTRQVSGTLIAAAVVLIFVALAVIFEGSTGIAGVFVMGMAGGLLIGTRWPSPQSSSPVPPPN